MRTHTLKKSERLSSKKVIEELFAKGSYFYLHPFKVVYLKAASDSLINQVLITVPKRNFKKAVTRNKLKRRVREAFRLNKSGLHTTDHLLIAYIYTAKDILPFSIIEPAVRASIAKLNDGYDS